MAIMLSFALALAPPAAPRWSRLPDLPIGLGGPAVGVHGRTLICVGGSYFPVSLFQGGTKKWVDEVQVLEYGAASWRSVGQLPHPLAYAGVVPNVDGPILLGGSDGQQHYRDVFRLAYNGLGVVRHDLPPLPEPIAYAAVARAGDVVYVAGGQTSPDAPTGEPRGWMLDLAADEPAWQPLPPWPGPGRMLSAAAGYRGDFYVFSGCSLAAVDGAMRRTYFADSYRFRPGEGWTKLADLPRPAVAAGSPAHVHDGRIWIFGGDTGELAERIPELKEDHPGFPHTTLVYDPAADRWDELPGLPFSQLTTSLTAIEDRPVLASGEDRPGHRAPACWIADWPLDEARQFVSGGQLLAVREEGGPWAVADGYATRQGMGPILWGDGAVGSGDFTVTMQLVIDDLARSAASVCIDGRSHFGFEGAGGETFLSGPLFTKATRLVDGPWIASGKPFTLTIRREGKVTTFAVDRRPVVMVETGTGRFGTVGLRPWRATMKVAAFRVDGQLAAPFPPHEQPRQYTIPVVDVMEQAQRVVIARGTKDVYQGHPTTLLLPDHKTMFAVWTTGHGGTCGPLKRSDDGGLTWSELIPVPANWTTTRNCPAIHRLVDPRGKARLLVLAGNGDMMQSVSDDEGRTWTPMAPNGLRCVVAPNTVIPIRGDRYLGIYHRRPESQDRSPLRIWQATTADGGLTWQDERGVGQREAADLCEPALIRSPDGRRLACVMRENARRYNSFIMFSDDDGEHWSTPVEVPAALTGDRHLARYAPDGRLLMVFRDTAHSGPTRGDFVGWVGTFDDLVNLSEGQYRFRLFHSPKPFDLGYPGLELLPDGTFVATTYTQLAEGEQHSVVSFRFKIEGLDRALAAGQVVAP